MIQIYNTLTREKETFVPLEEGKVKMYVCGPTVYNYIHIGNARSTVAFDTVRKYLEYRGFEVNYVSNFTDVDDKIIRSAQEEGISPQELAEKYIQAFKEDTGALNVKPATVHPQVVDHMTYIITFIEELIAKEFAYVSAGDVYYRTRKFKHYGQLSHQAIDELEVGASQRTGSEQDKKEDPLDFALWKSAKDGEISWESPWGAGRPGWHIECSVMASKHLGDTIDIHAGGEDLQFPHHENEIAQSEAKTGKKFANYWMHNGFVTVGDGEKMSKSLGNFVTAHELMQQVDPMIIRFALATTQYRRPIPFNDATIKDAENNLARLQTAFDNASFRQAQASTELEEDAEDLNTLAALEDEFVRAMDDDFNTANGITVVYDLVKWLNQYSERTDVSEVVLTTALEKLTNWLLIFGVTLQVTAELLDEEIDRLITERNEARVAKNFARSDEIRDLLKDEGIILEDTPQGVRWRRS
ncbi:cysteine--tRNA ligase [Vagococcus xieshaowenii]|uniref:Cysteine--tRNA ligase n=1 Tax=Vagococcus xieshaowenii TaxID=2562451 RepID=A0AAJ5EEZ8_9ENTE|nr:cysteine--tRNA ligase [Vagococcus xieshaowenii]QCA27889.1 cysteine--tRNA ligase [Vagococcus xieshaowenii]TFZ39432.1 cysteine--tRNA ligase [Vagococcus xieshaowenii]